MMIYDQWSMIILDLKIRETIFNDWNRAISEANYQTADNYQVGDRYRVERFESSENRSWLKIKSHPGAVIMFQKKRTERNVLFSVYRCRQWDEGKGTNEKLPCVWESRIAPHKKKNSLVSHIAMQYRAVLCRSALQLRLMKLSVQNVYRWGLPACGPFTTIAARLVRSALHFYFYLTNRFEFVEPRDALCLNKIDRRFHHRRRRYRQSSLSLLLKSQLFVVVSAVKLWQKTIIIIE